MVLHMIGNAGYGGHWLSVMCAAAIIATFYFKLRVEEKMLLQHFGAEYAKYQKTTAQLLPFL